jgi:hypothetical protein
MLLVGAGFAVAAALLYALSGPIPQSPAYHDFADARPLGPIPNAWNVLSNLPFALVGALGVRAVLRSGAARPEGALVPWEREGFLGLFAGVFLVSLGSAYYHAFPSNATLAWDRLPMSIAFMALFALVLGDRVSAGAARTLLRPTVLAGIASVLHWRLTERAGAGDLRAYALVQGFPVLVIPLLLALRAGRAPGGVWVASSIAAYLAAKLAEHADRAVFDASGALISGHALKHLLAGLGAWFLLRWLEARLPPVAPPACEAGRAGP